MYATEPGRSWKNHILWSKLQMAAIHIERQLHTSNKHLECCKFHTCACLLSHIGCWLIMANGKWELCLLLIAVYVHILLTVTAKGTEEEKQAVLLKEWQYILDQSFLRQQGKKMITSIDFKQVINCLWTTCDNDQWMHRQSFFFCSNYSERRLNAILSCRKQVKNINRKRSTTAGHIKRQVNSLQITRRSFFLEPVLNDINT